MTAQLDRRTFLEKVAAGGALLPAAMSCARGKVAWAGPADQSADGTPVLDDAAQLFVDLQQVELLEGVRQEFHAAEKHPANPVLRKEKPWENDRGTWGSVSFDPQEKIFKMVTANAL